MPWRCSWWEPTDEVRVDLRRYRSNKSGDNCSLSGWGYHNATARWPRTRTARWKDSEDGTRYLATTDPIERDHELWPTHCACGYEFTEDDSYQETQQLVYRNRKLRVPDRELPVGAMYDAWWLKYEGSPYVGDDGISLAVILPPKVAEGHQPHVWLVDGRSSDGGRWTRTGNPKKPETLSVSPSILTAEYHSFLTAGRLGDSLGDRPLAPGPDPD